MSVDGAAPTGRSATSTSTANSSTIGSPTESGSGASTSVSEWAPHPWSRVITLPSEGLHSLAQTPKVERRAPAIGRK